MTYEEIRPSLDTGDVVLMGGRGIVSTVIKAITASPYSHVGMIVRMPDPSSPVFIFESTIMSTAKDVDAGEVLAGVSMVTASGRLDGFEGEIRIRQLLGSASPARRYDVAMSLRSELRGRPYQQIGMGELFKSAYDGPFGHNFQDLSSVFCSELVGEYLKRLGALPDTLPSNELTPADFQQNRLIDRMVPNLFGPEIIIERQ